MIGRGLVTTALLLASFIATGCPGSGGRSATAVPTEVEIEWPDAAVPEPTRDAATPAASGAASRPVARTGAIARASETTP